jgi:hypothetical protein
MRLGRTLVLVGSVLALLVAPALASSARLAYRVMVNTRLGGGLVLAPGDRVVCRIPGHWLAVTLPAANASGVIYARTQIVSTHSLLWLTVTKNVTTGQGVIACMRRPR